MQRTTKEVNEMAQMLRGEIPYKKKRALNLCKILKEKVENPFTATIEFGINIECGEKLREKIFKVHSLVGGSNLAISETIELIMNTGVNKLIKKLDKKERKVLDKTKIL